jgi:acylphosphatase
MKAQHLIIRGRVQGVWFRASSQDMARNLKIKGWVRNTPQGNVEMHIQGDSSQLEKMLTWCYQGPPGARVDSVDVMDVIPNDEFKAFNIRYY